MKFKPILFSTDMVKAILEGRKTQTRRGTKLGFASEKGGEFEWHLEGTETDPDVIVGAYANGEDKIVGKKGFWAFFGWSGFGDIHKGVQCPYGQVCDVLWLRESAMEFYDTCDHPELVGCPQERWTTGWAYKTDHIEYHNGWAYVNSKIIAGYRSAWKPSIHMPKSACRIFLQITDIRVERLKDISEEDAIAEGIDMSKTSGQWAFTPAQEYEELWGRINGLDSWKANPFVWCLTFARIDKPTTF